jgi:hypothetical protein
MLVAEILNSEELANSFRVDLGILSLLPGLKPTLG